MTALAVSWLAGLLVGGSAAVVLAAPFRTYTQATRR